MSRSSRDASRWLACLLVAWIAAWVGCSSEDKKTDPSKTGSGVTVTSPDGEVPSPPVVGEQPKPHVTYVPQPEFQKTEKASEPIYQAKPYVPPQDSDVPETPKAPAAAPAPKAEPAKVEPAKTEPAKVESVKTEPKVEPAKVEPEKTEPAKTESKKSEPKNSDSKPSEKKPKKSDKKSDSDK